MYIQRSLYGSRLYDARASALFAHGFSLFQCPLLLFGNNFNNDFNRIVCFNFNESTFLQVHNPGNIIVHKAHC